MFPLLLVLVAVPDAGVQNAPSPREMAQLFFLAGDLQRAIEQGRRCVQLEGKKKCEPFYRALVEYEALIRKNDQLTRDEAKAYLEWDRFISPQAHGKLTQPVLHRWVESPLEGAQRAHAAGDDKAARELTETVLFVDPKNAEAKELHDALPPVSR